MVTEKVEHTGEIVIVPAKKPEKEKGEDDEETCFVPCCGAGVSVERLRTCRRWRRDWEPSLPKVRRKRLVGNFPRQQTP